MDLLLTDDEIYEAVTYGFNKKVEATNLTDEIELKRHEGAKMVAQAQLAKIKAEIEKMKKPYPSKHYDAYIVTYNQAIQDILKLLEG